jgi:excisionase family DNA binding protein
MGKFEKPAALQRDGLSEGVRMGSEQSKNTRVGAVGARNLVSAKAVAARLSVSRTYLYDLIRKHGFPPALMVGGKLAWRQDQVDAWIEARAEARSNG